MGLLLVAHTAYREVSMVRDLDRPPTTWDPEPGQRPSDDQRADSVARGGLAVVDNVLLCLCCENLLKAHLLLQGYVVHLFVDRSPAHKQLFDLQRSEPIPISSLPEFPGLSSNPPTIDRIDSLKRRSLGLHTLVTEEKYRAVLGLPPEISTTMDHWRMHRNRLHFSPGDEPRMGPHMIRWQRAFRTFIDSWLVDVHNRLVEGLHLGVRLDKFTPVPSF